jgi:hypothetical protein
MPDERVVAQWPGLISFWDFQEPPGRPRVAFGPQRYQLLERGSVPYAREGVFGPQSAQFGGGGWLEVPRAQGPALNIHGPDAQVTVVAWLKRTHAPGNACEAVAGVWNEHDRRQYCLFLNLGIHNSSQQVCAHVSATGGPTPGFRYCMEAAIGATHVPLDVWRCVAMSYDGTFARACLDGQLDARGDRNPARYPGGLFNAGPDGADFTVGAVARPERVDLIDGKPVASGHVQSNLFYGLLGGLAVFNRALPATEIDALADQIRG